VRWKSITFGAGITIMAISAQAGEVQWWRSAEDGSASLSAQTALSLSDTIPVSDTTIVIDPTRRYQPILGMGASLEHATCYNLSKLGDEKRREVIQKIVDPEVGMGMNLMRVCIGTSDFVGEPYYSYNDLPAGETDPELKGFSIEKDREYVIPAIKTALELNPDLLIFASPWSPPGWMKSRGNMSGGRLLPEWYDAFARYMVKFVQAYEAEGIPIHAVTPQNEPAHADPNYPTTFYRPDDLNAFVRDHLGPRLREAGLDTEIWCWDHNYNKLEYPRASLSDPETMKYVSGVGFHFYEGEPEAMSEIHNEYPEVPIYFTEGSTFQTRGALQIINIFRNWARSYNAWVIMLDEHRKPNNGPHSASATPIELKDDLSLEYRFDYYMYGQFMKFIERGAVRIDSGEGGGRFSHVAFQNPDDAIVLVVANGERRARSFTVHGPGGAFESSLGPREVATYRWQPSGQ